MSHAMHHNAGPGAAASAAPHAHRSPAEIQAESLSLLAAQPAGFPELPLKARLNIPVQDMPCQDPVARGKNMQEVALGYSPEQARLEAARCLQCKTKPCVSGCPVNIDIPGFLAKAAEGDFAASLAVIQDASLLPAICGRVCPQETQCQEQCTVGKSLKSIDRAVAIGRVERFVADWAAEHGGTATPAIAPATGKKVAVVGSGPAAIACAGDLRRAGHAVTVLEAFHKPGGVLIYGIPEFRLPKTIVERELAGLEAMGVEIRRNFLVGRTRKLTDLLDKDGYDAVFIGSGAGLPKFMRIEGENLVGVFAANEYLTRSNMMKAYDTAAATPIFRSRKVAVLGGGNVAMDAARSALRLGAEEVSIIYRRSLAEMPARAEEVAHAQEEGIKFLMLSNATRILGDAEGKVRAVEVLKFELGEPDASGRRSPVPLENSEYELEMDTVIVAIGNDSNPLLRQTTPELKTDKYGRIVCDADLRTSISGVYAGGDIVLGAATVILAMGQGRQAAASINADLAAKG
jgi:glutamate synthase (NADPH/NADH) small chain